MQLQNTTKAIQIHITGLLTITFSFQLPRIAFKIILIIFMVNNNIPVRRQEKNSEITRKRRRRGQIGRN